MEQKQPKQLQLIKTQTSSESKPSKFSSTVNIVQEKIHLPSLPPPLQDLLCLDLALPVDRLQPGLSYYSENE
jgi:hypothetical protein